MFTGYFPSAIDIETGAVRLNDGYSFDAGKNKKEEAIFNMHEDWLTAQIGKQRTFLWGTIEAIYIPRPDGPGEPVIYLQYQ